MSPDARQDFALAFLSILFEGAPFILLGTVLSGFIDVYLPSGAMDRLLPRNRNLAVFAAGLMGAIFPVCECAVVPVIRRLVSKGLPVSCALTYMLAAPIVNPITALSTWKAFQGQNAEMMTGGRLALGFLVACAVGLVVSKLPLRKILKDQLADELEEETTTENRHHHHHEHGDGCGHDHHHDHEGCCGHDHDHHHHHDEKPDPDTRLVAAFRSAMKDFVDVGTYFSIGVVITALFNTGIAPGAEWLDTLATHPATSSAAMMTLAFVLSLCSTSDAFIAATLDKFSWAAKLAFLTFGPMMDVKLIFLYQTVLRKRFILILAASLFIGIGAITVFWHHLMFPTP
ncbi:MAG: permease [Akkermansiaceae bacterium]|nr:permease [Akkermansiaceae bacterium]